MRILLIYHFFHPDTVISARLFSDLAEELAAAGHRVTVFTGNRLIRSEEVLPEHELWRGVEICRFARPGFKQGSNVGRLLNSFVLQRKWLTAFKARRDDFDAVVLGTDPQFGYLMYPGLRRLAPKARLVHWCFDLYPEAVMATGSRLMAVLGALFKPLARRAYRRVDDMVDIGECMRGRLASYGHRARCATATPWALAESATVAASEGLVRRKLFGEAKLCFLYSGTVGHAHDIGPFIALARECRRRGLPVGFCFAGYGNRYAAQTAQLTAADTNISMAGFASEEELSARLSAADFHLISLREGWEGIVVPSKFFGALAMGRPVLFSGPAASEINGWIGEYGLGYRLEDGIIGVIEELLAKPELVEALKARSLAVYKEHFSRSAVVGEWKKILTTEHTEYTEQTELGEGRREC